VRHIPAGVISYLATSGPNSCSDSTGRAAVRISGTLNDFLTSHLTYSMLQSIPICTEYNRCGRSRYMIYGVRSRISLYCIRRRMVRLRMRVALLPLMALRLTPVLVLAKIMLFSFGTKPLPIRATDCTALNMTNVATASVFHILLESNQLFMRAQT
jgi:hypothetical protein